MFLRKVSPAILCCNFLFVIPAIAAQETTIPNAAEPPWVVEARPADRQPTPPAGPQSRPIVVPTGTRLPLVLRNGINTRTAKPGDSVYFETIYPIAQDNRIVIPMGSFVRGEVLGSKRPGFVKGRGQIRMGLLQITFSNGYTLALAATPSSADRDGKEGVDREGTVRGPAKNGRDLEIVLVATGGGAYIGTLAGAIESGAAGTGALMGGGIGAAAGILAILVTRGPEAELPRGTTLDVVFDRPLVLDASLVPANEPGKVSEGAAVGAAPWPAKEQEPRPRRRPLSRLPLPF